MILMDSGGHHPMPAPKPGLSPVPEKTRGFRLQVDLRQTKPPVWRRIDVPGDIALLELHGVLQAAMGWTDSHLHRFRTGGGYGSAALLSPFDVEEGEDGLPESDVRLDQVVAAPGDRLWYDYDFGDGWKHVLLVEKVLEDPPEAPVCIKGRLACPPEDCGGIRGYQEIADWVRSGYNEGRRPDVFDSSDEAIDWLPPDWHPDLFDIEEANDRMAGPPEELRHFW